MLRLRRRPRRLLPMATPPPDVAERAKQTVIATAMSTALARAWTLYDPALPSTVDRWIAAVYALVNRFGKGSSTSAAAYYDRVRRQAVPGSYTSMNAHGP